MNTDLDHPVVVVDGNRWDLSNLTSRGHVYDVGTRYSQAFQSRLNCHDHERIVRDTYEPDESQLRHGRSETFRFYPSVNDIPASLDVDEIFDKLSASGMLENAPPANPSLDGRLVPESKFETSDQRRSRRNSYQDTSRNINRRGRDDYKSSIIRRDDFRQNAARDDFRRNSYSTSNDCRRNNGRIGRGYSVPHEEPVTCSQDRTMVEVMPGEFVALRGSAETWDAVQFGRVTTTTCSCCLLSLVCIEDADMIMCPGCRVISSVNGGRAGGGLGLGMSVQDARHELRRRGLYDHSY